ncbi:MAG: hypothetical protein D4R64_09255 [Porphyromonadaceae bacterium]|nr:MAG: hypothetical protein D4R64_09255 [Porphyromonadaceae bacterium]
MKNLFKFVRGHFLPLLIVLSVVIGLVVNNSCDPDATGTVNPSVIASSQEYADFASVYVATYAALNPVITGLTAADSMHFWDHLLLLELNNDTSQLTYCTNILQQHTTLDVLGISQNVVEAATALLVAYPALNLATEEQFTEIADIGYTNNIWPPDFPWGNLNEMKSGLDINITPCQQDCRNTYRNAKVGAIGEFAFCVCIATLALFIPGAQGGSATLVAVSSGRLAKDAINIERNYSNCWAGCPH